MDSRLYSGEQDLRDMARLVSAGWAAHGPRFEFTVGDLDWRMNCNGFVQPRENVRLWHDARGQLAGFAWGYVNGDIDLVIHPREHAAALAPRMLDWARAWFSAHPGTGPQPRRVWVLESNTLVTRELERLGWRRHDSECYLHLAQPVRAPAPAPLPSGYTLRSVRGPEEAAARAAVHRRGFGSERVTTEVYQRVMKTAHYRFHLDLVAEGPGGELAALALCWLDEQNGVGEFEPVATAPEHRRKGLSYALLLEGLRRLHAAGARTAVVYATSANPGSVALYESAGFRTVDRNWGHVSP